MRARAGYLVVAVFTSLWLPALAAREERPITISVTPGTCVEPCSVRLAVRIARDDSNRSVTIAAESPQFFRRSTRQLDGLQAPRLHELILNQIPSGAYEVRVIVSRADGPPVESKARFMVGTT